LFVNLLKFENFIITWLIIQITRINGCALLKNRDDDHDHEDDYNVVNDDYGVISSFITHFIIIKITKGNISW